MDDFRITHKMPVLKADLGGFVKPFTPQVRPPEASTGTGYRDDLGCK